MAEDDVGARHFSRDHSAPRTSATQHVQAQFKAIASASICIVERIWKKPCCNLYNPCSTNGYSVDIENLACSECTLDITSGIQEAIGV